MLTVLKERLYPVVTPSRLSFKLPDGFQLITDSDFASEDGCILSDPEHKLEISIGLARLENGENTYTKLENLYGMYSKPDSFVCQGYAGDWICAPMGKEIDLTYLVNVGNLNLVDRYGDKLDMVEMVISVTEPGCFRELFEKYQLDALLDRILVIE